MTRELYLIVVPVAGVVFLLMLLGIIARMYRKVGPNQALIIYGMGGTRVVTGSGAFVFPMIQSCRELSLELMSFDVAPQKELYTHQGVAVLIDAVTQLKVRSDLANVRTAAEQFLDKTEEQREAAIRLVMEGHLRGIVGQLTVEQIVKEPEMVGDKVRSTCAADLAKMGLEMVSFTIKEVRDQNEYIKHMGLPDIERIKKEANIASAEAQRDTEIKRSQATREAAVARAEADRERVIAETASLAKQAEAQRDLEIKKAQYTELIQRQRAQADKAYEIQANVMQQQVIVEQVRIQQVERSEQVKVQEAEIARRKNELIANELEAANVEAQRRQVLADAERQRLELEAQGHAEAIRKQGLAEAEVIRVKGEAEAAAMNVKAQAYRGYTEAAVLDKLLGGLPEVARAIAQPLSHVDRITVISTDGGANGSAGVSKITADVAKMVAQVPALIESLSGVSIGELLRSLPGFAQRLGQPAPAVAAAANPRELRAQAAGPEPASPTQPPTAG
jgi:flotillin